MLKKLSSVLIFIFLCSPTYSYAQHCGFKPYAQFGCKIGRCVNGKWEQICGDSDTGHSDSINSMIANPKMADIAGALEARQRRLDAEEARKGQSTLPHQAAPVQSTLLVFEQLRREDEASAIAIMSGLGLGFVTANSMLALKDMPPLYCQPSHLALNAENYMQIYEAKLEKNRAKIEKLKEANPAQVLLFGLIDTFPCQPAK